MIKGAATRVFRWFCRPDYYPDIKGDLEELYQDHLDANEKMAEWKYAVDVLLLMRPSLMRPLFINSIIYTGMFKNYFKISVRNLIKHRVFTGINVIGLALGLTAFLLINEYIQFERSYDRFFTDSDQLYRLTTDQITEGVIGTRDAMSFNPSGKVLTEELPEVLNYTTTFMFNDLVFRHNDRIVEERKVIAVDSNYFKLFDYEILGGDVETMLNEPNSLILTESKARAYFGDENPIGKTLYVMGRFQRPFKITGVMQDVPGNTHYKYKMLISLKTRQEQLLNDQWNNFNYYTYLTIDRNADLEALRKKLPELSRKYLGEDGDLYFNLQPVHDIHLHSDYTYEPEIHGSAKSISFLVVISIFILVIAWVNYVNLSTARAIDRAKEVGLRKVIGAHRKQLIVQFLLESLIVNLLGALIAILLAELFLPYFNQLIGKQVTVHVWNNLDFLKNLAIFFAIGTVISGFYPAMVLSQFRPVTVLRGKFRNSKKGVLLRKGLVVVQFAASLVLIASTFIVTKQVDYMLSKDLGIDINYVVGFQNPGYSQDQGEEMSTRLKSFKEKLVSHHAVLNAGMSTSMPGGGSSDVSSTAGGVKIVGQTEKIDGTVYREWTDDTCMPTIGQQLIHGRNFDATRQTDTAATVVNEAFLRRLGVKDLEAMLNEQIQFGTNPENDKYTIIGIIKNYHRTTLKNSVEPTSYFYWSRPNYTMVKLSRENYQEGLEHVQKTWDEFFPESPLAYSFLDERFERLYAEDKRFGSVFGTFSVLAILVAILGLFGLSAFMALQRAKEVGVRKVLGASTHGIVGIFFRDFLSLIGISTLIGVPAIYFGMESWLGNYANRIDFPWLLIAAGILLIVIFAFVTVGYQTYKVAIMNPSETLQYE